MITTSIEQTRLRRAAAPLALSLALSASAFAGAPLMLTLEGAAEVPPVNTPASGSGRISLQDDNHLLKGSIDVSGVDATAAHIHEGASGENGPAIITLVKDDDDTFSIPQDTRLTEAQYKSFLGGKLYVNVHSQRYPDGEIRAQLVVGR